MDLHSMYRVPHLVVHMGWVNSDFGCSTARAVGNLVKVARQLGNTVK